MLSSLFAGTVNMMTASNGNIFRVTDHLCGEFTGHRWIPRTKVSDVELWCFFDKRPNKRLSKQWWGWWFETPSRQLWRHCNDWMCFQVIIPLCNTVYNLCDSIKACYSQVTMSIGIWTARCVKSLVMVKWHGNCWITIIRASYKHSRFRHDLLMLESGVVFPTVKWDRNAFYITGHSCGESVDSTPK